MRPHEAQRGFIRPRPVGRNASYGRGSIILIHMYSRYLEVKAQILIRRNVFPGDVRMMCSIYFPLSELEMMTE